jgi:hypothetical protein
MLMLFLKVKFIMNLINLFFIKGKNLLKLCFGESNFKFNFKKLIQSIINFTFKIKINMRNDGHFGQLKIFSKKVFIFRKNVLRSMMFQVYFRKIHQIPIDKMNS